MPVKTDAYGRLAKSLLEEPEPLRARTPPAPFRLENPAILDPPPKPASEAPRAAVSGGRKERQEADASALEQQLGLPAGSVPRKTGTSPWLALTTPGRAHASNLQRHRSGTIDDLLGAKRENRADEQFGLQERRLSLADEKQDAYTRRQEKLDAARSEKEESDRNVKGLLWGLEHAADPQGYLKQHPKLEEYGFDLEATLKQPETSEQKTSDEISRRKALISAGVMQPPRPRLVADKWESDPAYRDEVAQFTAELGRDLTPDERGQLKADIARERIQKRQSSGVTEDQRAKDMEELRRLDIDIKRRTKEEKDWLASAMSAATD